MKIGIGLAALALLAACGQEEGAGGLTAEESRQLNEAAAMLDGEANGLGNAGETAGSEGAAGEASSEGY